MITSTISPHKPHSPQGLLLPIYPKLPLNFFHFFLCTQKYFHRPRVQAVEPILSPMSLSSIISEINRDIGRKSRFFSYPPAFDAPVRGFPSEYYHTVWSLFYRRFYCIRYVIVYMYIRLFIPFSDRQCIFVNYNQYSRLYNPIAQFSLRLIINTTYCCNLDRVSKNCTLFVVVV